MIETEDKWTIRGVDPDARYAVELIRAATGIPFGRLVTEAIWCWYDQLPEGNPIPITKPAA